MTIESDGADAFKAGLAAGLMLAVAGTLSETDRAAIEALLDRLHDEPETSRPNWEQVIVSALSECAPARRLLLQVLGPDALRTSIQAPNTPMPQVANIYELTRSGVKTRVRGSGPAPDKR